MFMNTAEAQGENSTVIEMHISVNISIVICCICFLLAIVVPMILKDRGGIQTSGRQTGALTRELSAQEDRVDHADQSAGATATGARQEIQLTTQGASNTAQRSSSDGGAAGAALRERCPTMRVRGVSNTTTAEEPQIAVRLLREWKVVQLKSALRMRGIPVTGLKAELIGRMIDAVQMPPEAMLTEALEVLKRRGARPDIEVILSETSLGAWIAGEPSQDDQALMR